MAEKDFPQAGRAGGRAGRRSCRGVAVISKIIFRDISIQHFSASKPVYEELVRRGFDCEAQVLEVPRLADLLEFTEKHKDDPHDLMVTASLTRYIFARELLKGKTRHRENYVKSEGGQEKAVFMSHGVGGEENPGTRYHKFKSVFLAGQFWMDLFAKFADFKNLRLIGYPKLDLLAQRKRHKVARRLRDELDLPHEKTVLYAPTLERLDSFDGTIRHLLAMFESLDINLLVKAHCDDEDKEYQPELFREAKHWAEEMENARWVGGTYPDITPLYLVSDVVLGASSGCLREFMLTGRPSVQLTNVSEELRKKFRYEGCIQSSLNDLKKNLLRAVYVPEWMRDERREQVKLLFHEPDGHATNRAADAIEELMNW